MRLWIPMACATFVLSSLALPSLGIAQGGQGSVTIALAPLETLGAESKASSKTQKLIARALSKIGGHKLVADKKVRRALRKNPQLRACGGKDDCRAKLGATLGARYVVFGEVGGLGSAEVVYLQLIDVAAAKTVRSTTLELGGGNPKQAARGAAYQLLAPEQYVGRLATKVDTEGASIYVDGQRLGKSPAPPIPLTVGSHAVRITHPEYRDYVRFVDIAFDQETAIEASLQEFPVVATDLTQDPDAIKKGQGPSVIYKGQEPTPWYRKWYGVAGVGGAALITSALLVGLIANGVDVDDTRVIRTPDL